MNRSSSSVWRTFMKKILVCLILAFSAILTLPNPTAVIAQKREQKAGKESSPATKQLSKEQTESILQEIKEREGAASKLKFQQGVITLKDQLATLKVPTSFRYLDPDQSETVL